MLSFGPALVRGPRPEPVVLSGLLERRRLAARGRGRRSVSMAMRMAVRLARLAAPEDSERLLHDEERREADEDPEPALATTMPDTRQTRTRDGMEKTSVSQ